MKELGYEATLLNYLEGQRVLAQSFLFDMDLIEAEPGATASLLRQLHPTVRLATRVSDRREPLERALESDLTSIVWLDEFDRLWATQQEVRRLKDAGRTVYAVSPELHGFSLAQARSRWMDFVRWGVDGICTDYPDALERAMAEMTSLAGAAGVDRRPPPSAASPSGLSHDAAPARRHGPGLDGGRLRARLLSDHRVRGRLPALRRRRRRSRCTCTASPPRSHSSRRDARA